MSPRPRPTTDGPPHAGGNSPARTPRPPQPPYPAAFRKEAVALVRRSTGAIPQLARELGVHQETLRLWVKQAQIDAGEREGVPTDAQAEITRLRREVARLTAERDLLKEATAFFARESAPR